MRNMFHPSMKLANGTYRFHSARHVMNFHVFWIQPCWRSYMLTHRPSDPGGHSGSHPPTPPTISHPLITIHSPTHSWNYFECPAPFTFHWPIYLFTFRSPIHPTRPLTFSHGLTHSTFHFVTYSFINRSVRPVIRPPIHGFIYSSVLPYSCVQPFIESFIFSFRPSFPHTCFSSPWQNCNFWGGLGGGGLITFLACMCIHGRCYGIVALFLHTCSMLQNWRGGDDDVPCMCIHLRCYALAHKSVLHNWWACSGVGKMSFLACAYMWDATEIVRCCCTQAPCDASVN